MHITTIKKNPNGDTRSAPKGVTYEQFQEANDSHRKDVESVMEGLADMLANQGFRHDWTKKVYEEDFYKDFIAAQNGADFVSLPWYQLHIDKESHHPGSKCHDDITLLDIIETIADCICAGKARTGEVFPIEFDAEILSKAVTNTVALVDSMTKVKGG